MHRETEKDGLGVLCTAAALDDVNHLDLGPDVMVEAPKARRLVDDWLGLIWDSNHQKYRDFLVDVVIIVISSPSLNTSEQGGAPVR